MADKTAIEWTDATFNPWWGCQRVSPACAHCYADALAHRYGHRLWDASRSRRFFSDAHWQKPLAWNKAAQKRGASMRVFCASMADVFEDHAELGQWRARLWNLIEQTPRLEWQLLTKRPENVKSMVPWAYEWPANVWIGASVESSRYTFRADILRELPAAVRFISAEPLLGSLFLNRKPNRRPLDLTDIHWLIAGGESGPRHRGVNVEWLHELRDACRVSATAFFFKQYGGRTAKAGGRTLDGRTHDEFPRHRRLATAVESRPSRRH